MVVNAASGRGRGSVVGAQLERAAREAGHEVVRADVGGRAPGECAKLLPTDCGALVVVGGDGTVHSIASWASENRTPVYHAPVGTENLFAREFGMDERGASLVGALEAGRMAQIDLAVCNDRLYVLMASLGMDAGVIHRLARGRTGSIGHWSYAWPILEECRCGQPARVTIEVDGRRVVDTGMGAALVANSRQYAVRLDPAHDARMDDGLLDLVFLPHQSIAELLRWGVLARLRRLEGDSRVVRARGERIEVRAEGDGFPMQIDGEAEGDGRTERAVMEVMPGALRVLLPVG